jgi:hypothetical protein
MSFESNTLLELTLGITLLELTLGIGIDEDIFNIKSNSQKVIVCVNNFLRKS